MVRQSHESHVTTDHDVIRGWVESRGGQPAAVKETGGGDDVGILRVDFPGYGDDSALEGISWEDFFAKFEQNHLAFLYQDRTKNGEMSRFFKFVRRDSLH